MKLHNVVRPLIHFSKSYRNSKGFPYKKDLLTSLSSFSILIIKRKLASTTKKNTKVGERKLAEDEIKEKQDAYSISCSECGTRMLGRINFE